MPTSFSHTQLERKLSANQEKKRSKLHLMFIYVRNIFTFHKCRFSLSLQHSSSSGEALSFSIFLLLWICFHLREFHSRSLTARAATMKKADLSAQAAWKIAKQTKSFRCFFLFGKKLNLWERKCGERFLTPQLVCLFSIAAFHLHFTQSHHHDRVERKREMRYRELNKIRKKLNYEECFTIQLDVKTAD